jgi:DnaJ-class molecular chaperone
MGGMGGNPFGFGGPMGAMGGMGGDPFGGMGGMGGPFGGMGGMGGMGGRPQGPRKDPPIEVKLACTLEELYSGTTKKMKINRQVGANRALRGTGWLQGRRSRA